MPAWQHEYLNGTPDPKQQRVIVRVDKRIDPSITRSEIQKNTRLADAKFFRNATNPQGTCFEVLRDVALELISLIDQWEPTPRSQGDPAAEGEGADALNHVSELPANNDTVESVESEEVKNSSNGAEENSFEVQVPGRSTGDDETEFDSNANKDTRETQLQEIALRPGQARFKARLVEAYSGRCAVTGWDLVDALEAAHIRRYVNESCHHIANGLLLRADIHALFDQNLIAIEDNWQVRVGGVLMNSEHGRSLDGLKLRLPANPQHHPSREALAAHRVNLRPRSTD